MASRGTCFGGVAGRIAQRAAERVSRSGAASVLLVRAFLSPDAAVSLVGRTCRSISGSPSDQIERGSRSVPPALTATAAATAGDCESARASSNQAGDSWRRAEAAMSAHCHVRHNLALVSHAARSRREIRGGFPRISDPPADSAPAARLWAELLKLRSRRVSKLRSSNAVAARRSGRAAGAGSFRATGSSRSPSLAGSPSAAGDQKRRRATRGADGIPHATPRPGAPRNSPR